MGRLLERYTAAKKEWEAKQPKPKPLLRSLPLAKLCTHNTGANGTAKAGCTTCTTYGCSVKGTVRLKDCVYCESFAYHEKPAVSAGNSWQAIRFDHENLYPGEIPGIRFNCSIIESTTHDGFLFSFRNGWIGSRLYLCRLTPDFKPIPKAWAKLELPTRGIVGHEDGRLFRLNGKLHIVYVAYGGRRTHVKFARIDEETLKVEDQFFPQLAGRASWEKNHSYYDYQGIAHAIYDTSPNHRILRIEGNQATWAHSTPFTGSYSGGLIRGGASPVMVDGHWWHFFHGVTTQANGRRRYNTGVIVFKPEPPFEIVSYTPDPIDEADIERKHDCWCDCLFICGVVYKDGRFITANGVHDRRCEIRFYDKAEIVQQLSMV